MDWLNLTVLLAAAHTTNRVRARQPTTLAASRKDLCASCLKQKKQGWFYGREYIYIYILTNILEGTVFLFQGLTYNEEVKLRRYNLK